VSHPSFFLANILLPEKLISITSENPPDNNPLISDVNSTGCISGT
jgi:hypothetical protein